MALPAPARAKIPQVEWSVHGQRRALAACAVGEQKPFIHHWHAGPCALAAFCSLLWLLASPVPATVAIPHREHGGRARRLAASSSLE